MNNTGNFEHLIQNGTDGRFFLIYRDVSYAVYMKRLQQIDYIDFLTEYRQQSDI